MIIVAHLYLSGVLSMEGKMKKIIRSILYLATIIIFSQAGKNCLAASVYNFTKDNQTTYKGEEIFVFKEDVSKEDFNCSEKPSYPEVKEIVLAEGVTSFNWDFLTSGYFPNIEIINISNTVAEIKSSGYRFYDELKKLKAVNVAGDNAYYTSDMGCLFNKNKTVLIQYPVALEKTSYYIPDTVTTIVGNAFINAENLQTVTIGAKVKSNQIGSIRDQLKDIKRFKVNSKNSSFSAKDGVLFNKKGETLLLYPNGKGTAYSVPVGTRNIKEYAFYHSKLKKIILPDGLKTIEDNAFSTCINLTSITIPNSVTKMNVLDFKYLDSLQSFNMQSGSKLYSSYAGILYNTTRTNIIFVPQAYKKTVLKFPSTLTSLALGGFNLENTTEINIPKALKELDIYNDNPKYFDKITLEAGNKYFILYKGSLYNKNKTELYLFKKQKKAEFPDTLKSLNIFYLINSGITEMVIPPNAQIITWTDNIYDIATLQKVTVDNRSKYYSMNNGMLLNKDGKVLYDIPKDTKVLDIPDNVRELNTSMIFDKRNLTSISIPKLFTEINRYDFNYLKYAETIEVDEDNSKFTSIDGILYNKDVTELIYYPVNKTNKIYVMPDTVKYILNCQSLIKNPYLESLTLSEALENRVYDLHKSNSLKEINVSEGNAYFKSVDGVLYNKDMTELIAYPYQKGNISYTIPDTVITVSGLCYYQYTFIDVYDFTIDTFSNPYLETLIVGKKVKTLFDTYENNPIWDFKNLQKIEVNNNNPYFSTKDGVLYNKDFTIMYLYPKDCKNIVLNIPDSVKDIRETFFDAVVNNMYLESIIVGNGNKDFSTDGLILSNYAGNYKYFKLGDTVYNRKIYSD